MKIELTEFEHLDSLTIMEIEKKRPSEFCKALNIIIKTNLNQKVINFFGYNFLNLKISKIQMIFVQKVQLKAFANFQSNAFSISQPICFTKLEFRKKQHKFCIGFAYFF